MSEKSTLMSVKSTFKVDFTDIKVDFTNFKVDFIDIKVDFSNFKVDFTNFKVDFTNFKVGKTKRKNHKVAPGSFRTLGIVWAVRFYFIIQKSEEENSGCNQRTGPPKEHAKFQQNVSSVNFVYISYHSFITTRQSNLHN